MTFEELLREAEADPDVVGVVLGGSRGKDALVTDHSDYDVYVIVRDASALVPHRRGEAVELITMTLEEFRRHALPGSPSAWNAYTFAHVTPLVDKLGGEIAELTAAKASVQPGSAADALDAYVNSCYRSAKNARDGLAFEARLDAAESVPYFLEFLFGVHGRVRPYNKWLRWELDEHPLEPPWSADELLPRLERILAGDQAEQRALFRDAERLARERSLGDVIDGWEPDVAWLRGDPSNEG